MDDLKTISIMQCRTIPIRAWHNAVIEFYGDAIAFQRKSCNKFGDIRDGIERLFFPIDYQFHRAITIPRHGTNEQAHAGRRS